MLASSTCFVMGRLKIFGKATYAVRSSAANWLVTVLPATCAAPHLCTNCAAAWLMHVGRECQRRLQVSCDSVGDGSSLLCPLGFCFSLFVGGPYIITPDH